MLAERRHEMILRLLDDKQLVSSDELARIMHVSIATVRRDLTLLHNQGMLVRQHGGAIKKKDKGTTSKQSEVPTDKKWNIHKEEKRQIALVASELVSDGDCIFLDSGTTPAYIYDYIRHKNVTIVTNNFLLVNQVKEKDAPRIVFGSGVYDLHHHCVFSSNFLELIHQFNFDLAFIGCNGFSVEKKQCSCTSLDTSSTKNYALSRSRRNILVADGSKQQEQGILCFATFSNFEQILTTYFPHDELPDLIRFCDQE
ncbi:MAG: DeoR/GlpR family DNA-binding transcription regulator [Erysipelotrichaceae bacterium]|jgi:DeoR family fructose operon transcriptional repressor|nr:DeoR/GlpR family DNA-binding transcription regulator [Erysipelotrichaceae bacterium]